MINTKHILYVGVFIGLTILGFLFLPKDEIVVIDNFNENTEDHGNSYRFTDSYSVSRLRNIFA